MTVVDGPGGTGPFLPPAGDLLHIDVKKLCRVPDGKDRRCTGAVRKSMAAAEPLQPLRHALWAGRGPCPVVRAAAPGGGLTDLPGPSRTRFSAWAASVATGVGPRVRQRLVIVGSGGGTTDLSSPHHSG